MVLRCPDLSEMTVSIALSNVYLVEVILYEIDGWRFTTLEKIPVRRRWSDTRRWMLWGREIRYVIWCKSVRRAFRNWSFSRKSMYFDAYALAFQFHQIAIPGSTKLAS